jgi:glycosyltransferase involved in cell wall biosynthesis
VRVLHFAGNYFPVPDGATLRVHNLLAAPENDHLLVVPWPVVADRSEGPGGVAAEESLGHIYVHRVDLPPAIRWARRVPFWRDRLQAREFVRRVQGETVDVLHGHNPVACAIASLNVKRRLGLPMVYEAHGIMRDTAYYQRVFGPLTPLNRMSWRLAARVTASVERQVVRAADHLIVQTDSTGRRLVALYGVGDKPITVIRNGVDAKKLDPAEWAAQRDAVRRRHAWDDRIVCLYAGYLDVVNGVEFLLQALPRLTGQTRRRLKIVLLGRGPQQRHVEQAASKHGDLLDYPGLVPHEQMPGYYAACDVFIIPRPPFLLAEMLLPLKLLEAMAMGKAVLVSDVAAMAEVVTDGRNGLVFEKGNHDDFLRKLARIIENHDQLECLGRRARQDVLERYNWDAARRQLQTIYEQLIG